MSDATRGPHLNVSVIMESSSEDVADMPFTASATFIVLTTIFLQFFFVCLAFEIAHQLEGTEIDYGLGEVDVQVRRDEVDTWLLVTANGEPLPEYSAVDSTPPPPYKDDVDLDVFIVEMNDDDNE